MADMKHAKIVLVAAGLAVIAICSYDFYLKHRVEVLFREVRAREQLRIPKQVRISLTDGTADGAAKGARWLEQQLGTRQGDLAALYVVDSLRGGRVMPLPCFRSHGFCGNVGRWEWRRCTVRAMERHLANVDSAIQQYLSDNDKPVLRPLPKVDWLSLTDIESKALSSVEAKNIGFLLVLSDGIADARFVPQTHPSHPYRVKFQRVGQTYDVRAPSASWAGIIDYELAGDPSVSSPNRVMRLALDAGDGDSDGLAGVTYLQFDTRFTPISKVLATRPSAPPWEDLVSAAQTSTGP
jgi:hypothetical protein